MAIAPLPSALAAFHRTDSVERMRVAAPATMPMVHLPSGLASNASHPASLSLKDAQNLVSKAQDALVEVRDGLAQLQKQAQAARDSSFLDAMEDLSRVTLQTDMQSLIRRMDDAVQSATVAGANLVSSQSRDVRLPTTGLGGSIVAAVQALDSKALGLSDIDLSTDDGVEAAVSAVSRALADLAAKDVRIQALSAAYQGQTDFNSLLQGVIATTSLGYAGYGGDARTQSTSGNRGSVVNVWA